MRDGDESAAAMRRLLTGRRYGVLATAGPNGPHASLVAFAAHDDLARIIFPTPRDTLKYSNLKSEPRAALLVDDRANSADDLERATALTIRGAARELTGRERREAAEVFLARHRSLKSFVDSPECALFTIEIASAGLAEGFSGTEGRPS